MRVAHINRYDMAYTEQGSGAPLVLIHGSLLDQRYWTPQMEVLGRQCRVVAVSLRHCWPERWDGVGNDFTMQQHVDDVAAFIAWLSVSPVNLLGHSRGGHVAFRVAQQFPDRVRALILAEPGGILDPTLHPTQAVEAPVQQGMSIGEATAKGAEIIGAGDVEGGLSLFVDAVNGPGAWEGMADHLKQMHRDNAYTLIGQLNERRPPFTRADMEGIQAATLLIGGEKSGRPFPQILDAMERLIAGSQRVTVPDTTHLMSEQNPAVFNSAVLDFLATKRA
jgi:pimeloyl-ACP methyl ester carboxylesterase